MNKQVKKAPKKKEVKKEKPSVPEGLLQKFKNKTGKEVTLLSVLVPTDAWEHKGRTFKSLIIRHDGVKKIADAAGISKDVDYQVLTQPTAYNNYQYTIQARVKRLKHLPNEENAASEIGETNRNNLRSRGKNNPGNMAQKRAYDRAVFRLLGITGILSDEELPDNEEEENDMPQELSHKDRKEIAPLINKLLLAKTEKDLITFNSFMKVEVKKYNPEQLEYLRKLYKKRAGEIKKITF